MIYNVTSASYESNAVMSPLEAIKYFSEKLDLVYQNIKVSYDLFYKDWDSMCPTYEIKTDVNIGEVIYPYKIEIYHNNGYKSYPHDRKGFNIDVLLEIPGMGSPAKFDIATFHLPVTKKPLQPIKWGKIKTDALEKLQENFKEREKYFKRHSLIAKMKKEFISIRFPIYVFMIGLGFMELCKYVELILRS